MQLTEVQVFLAEEDDERLKAYATVTFDNCFVVRDLKVINGNSGLFVAMPSKKRKDGTYKDIAHPINADFRKVIEQTVLGSYQDRIKTVRHAGEDLPVSANDDLVATPALTSTGEPANPAQAYPAGHDFEVGIGPAVAKS